MYFQLLGPPMPPAPAHYRGVSRRGPSYRDALSPSASANRAWHRYVSELGEKAPTEKIAVEIADALAAEGPAFDVIGLDFCTDAPPNADRGPVLGYEVTLRGGWYSLLSWGLHWDNEAAQRPGLGPLLALIEAYFRPRLNEGGLFSNWLDARRFLDVAAALSALSPGVWEAPGHEHLEIARLVAVRLASQSWSDTGVAAPQAAGV